MISLDFWGRCTRFLSLRTPRLEKYTGSGNATEAGSIRKSGLQRFASDNQSSNAPRNLPRKKRICPSRARRNAKRLQAFLDRKVPLVHHAPQKVLESVSQESSKVCLS